MTRAAEIKLQAVALAPLGRDALLTATLLKNAGIDATVAPDLTALAAALSSETAFVVVTEEAVRDADLSAVHDWIVAQESWSDLPFILVTFKGAGPSATLPLPAFRPRLATSLSSSGPFTRRPSSRSPDPR